MDQNRQSYWDNQFYQQMPRQKRASDYRAIARRVMKGNLGILVLAVFLAGLMGAMSSGMIVPELNLGSNGKLEINFNTETGLPDFSSIPSAEWRSLFVVFALATATAAVFSLLWSFFAGSPVMLGYRKLHLDLIDGKKPQIGTLFSYFRQGYVKSLGLRFAYALIQLLVNLPLIIASAIVAIVNFASFGVLFFSILRGEVAWELLPILLGSFLLLSLVAVLTSVVQLIVTYQYGFAFYVLAEYPQMRVIDALRNSRSLMKGNKWRLFCLRLSFLGWQILLVLSTVCTCGLGGIGGLFLTAYEQSAEAVFYDDVANRAAARETEFPSIDPNDYDPNARPF